MQGLNNCWRRASCKPVCGKPVFFCAQALLDRQQQAVVNGIFRRRMEMAGVDPRDRIAIAVSGGVDSMALCLLASEWKKQFPQRGRLIGFTVEDSEHPENSSQVQKWLKNIGIKCDILKSSAKDEGGRFIILHDACQRENIRILLSGHQADDLAELFIRRLSRCSGFSGLAAIPFVNELFPKTPSLGSKALRVVKPLVELYKSDLREVCRRAGQDWTERKQDSSLFGVSSSIRNQVQDLVLFYRKKRAEMEAENRRLFSDIVQVNKDYGFAVVSLERLLKKAPEDDVARRVLGATLRFVQQSAKAPRKRGASTALTLVKTRKQNNVRVEGCVLCRVDYYNVLVTASPKQERSTSSKPEIQQPKTSQQKRSVNWEAERLKFMSILKEPQALRIVLEETVKLLINLATDIAKGMHERQVAEVDNDAEDEDVDGHDDGEDRLTGSSKYYMNRFLISWFPTDPAKACQSDINELVASMRLRQMTASDVSKIRELVSPDMTEAWNRLESLHENVQLGLPVVVTKDDNVIAVPSVGLQFCPEIKFTSEYRPRFPLGGDHMIWT